MLNSRLRKCAALLAYISLLSPAIAGPSCRDLIQLHQSETRGFIPKDWRPIESEMVLPDGRTVREVRTIEVECSIQLDNINQSQVELASAILKLFSHPSPNSPIFVKEAAPSDLYPAIEVSDRDGNAFHVGHYLEVSHYYSNPGQAEGVKARFQKTYGAHDGRLTKKQVTVKGLKEVNGHIQLRWKNDLNAKGIDSTEDNRQMLIAAELRRIGFPHTEKSMIKKLSTTYKDRISVEVYADDHGTAKKVGFIAIGRESAQRLSADEHEIYRPTKELAFEIEFLQDFHENNGAQVQAFLQRLKDQISRLHIVLPEAS